MNEFGDRVRAARKHHGYSQQHVVYLLEQQGVHLTQSVLARIELGRRRPHVDEAVALARVLDFHLDDLFRNPEMELRVAREQVRMARHEVEEVEAKYRALVAKYPGTAAVVGEP